MKKIKEMTNLDNLFLKLIETNDMNAITTDPLQEV